jgi:hypothetical protein
MKRVVLLTFSLMLWFLGCVVSPEVNEEVRKLKTLELRHKNVVENLGDSAPDIIVEVLSGSVSESLKEEGLRLYFRERGSESFTTIIMGKAGTPSVFLASIPHQERGVWIEYYIEIRGIGGELLTFPGSAGEGIYYLLRFKGNVPRSLVILHIGTMLLGLLFFLFAAYKSWNYLKAKGGYGGIEAGSICGLLLFFIGGFPLGSLSEYYTFGEFWIGFPLGSDFTGTKTLLIFVFWILITGLFRATRAGGEDENKQRRYANLVFWGTILTVLVYLIPHGI